MLGDDVQAYAHAYQKYFAENAPFAKETKTILDSAPRVIIHPQRGVSCMGRNAKEAQIVQDIYRHTMMIILRAEALGGYQA
jgi:rhamnose utilization protein RhaD (predicted bifunctional aldolase and dehydrogenase)